LLIKKVKYAIVLNDDTTEEVFLTDEGFLEEDVELAELFDKLKLAEDEINNMNEPENYKIIEVKVYYDYDLNEESD